MRMQEKKYYKYMKSWVVFESSSSLGKIN